MLAVSLYVSNIPISFSLASWLILCWFLVGLPTVIHGVMAESEDDRRETE